MNFNPLMILFGVNLTPELMENQIRAAGIDLNVDEDNLDALITARIDKLANLVNEKYKFVESDGKDLVAHLAMRMISAADESGRVETWFLNNEGAALRLNLAYIRNNNPTAFTNLLKSLLFCDSVMPLKDFCYYKTDGDELALSKALGIRIINTFLAVDWRAIPSVVRSSGCIVYRGYAIVKDDSSGLIRQAVKNYELLLRKKVYALSGDITIEEIAFYKQFVDRLLRNIRETSTSFVGIENLEEEITFFPPCIAGLDARINQGFHMEHLEFLQLGFFLREAGMSINDYKRYWYFRHPSNRDKSWEEFSSSHWGGYQLEHHFGETGAGIQYSAYSCKKAQAEAFCPFKDYKDKELAGFLMSYLESRYETEEDKKRLSAEIKHILSLARKRHYGAACALEYKLRYREETGWINHPIFQYYKNSKDLNRRRNKTTFKRIVDRTNKQAE